MCCLPLWNTTCQLENRTINCPESDRSLSGLFLLVMKKQHRIVSITLQGGVSMNMYGYIRVSTKDQREDRQELAMFEFGVQPENIVVEKRSGKDFERPVYKRLLRKLKEEDILVIKSIDRLGRNYEEILDQWRYLTKKKKVAIVVLDMPLLDTRQGRDLTGTLISDIVLQLLSYVAQTEREFIRQRQAEGIAAAKARGVKFGRSKMERPENLSEYTDMWKNGTVSARQAAKALGISHTTFIKWANE